STFTRVAACPLALSPIRDTLIEGFSHFVTSMTAPIASGWSDCRVGFSPTGKRRLCTAHTLSRPSRLLFCALSVDPLTCDLPRPRIEHQAHRAGRVAQEGKAGVVAAIYEELVARH